ncbi:hypothetical protein C8J57DRAFT_1511601 [Mycena rebaudengoi]|nr:hypothetical protein C8J57DRAFT_1511601 [Mycena rebaudengoi]
MFSAFTGKGSRRRAGVVWSRELNAHACRLITQPRGSSFYLFLFFRPSARTQCLLVFRCPRRCLDLPGWLVPRPGEVPPLGDSGCAGAASLQRAWSLFLIGVDTEAGDDVLCIGLVFDQRCATSLPWCCVSQAPSVSWPFRRHGACPRRDLRALRALRGRALALPEFALLCSTRRRDLPAIAAGLAAPALILYSGSGSGAGTASLATCVCFETR